MTFFTFDIDEAINKGEWQSAEINGQNALQRRIELKPIQMDMFNLLDVTKFPDGSIWLDFLSSSYAPKNQLMDFMAYCASNWGPDSHGRGAPSTDDMEPLRHGTFGRSWRNVKIVQIKRPEAIFLSVALRIVIDNQDMRNFAKNLTKGLVRSAVNQVGRDGGRVISNLLYNNKNYVPIQNVNSAPQMEHPIDSVKNDTTPNAVVKNNLSAGSIILIILGIFVVPIGTIAVLIFGIARYLKNTTKITWVEKKPQYVRDRRYENGLRYIGDVNVPKSNVIAADDFSKSEYRRQGIILMVASGAFLLLFAISFVVS